MLLMQPRLVAAAPAAERASPAAAVPGGGAPSSSGEAAAAGGAQEPGAAGGAVRSAEELAAATAAEIAEALPLPLQREAAAPGRADPFAPLPSGHDNSLGVVLAQVRGGRTGRAALLLGFILLSIPLALMCS